MPAHVYKQVFDLDREIVVHSSTDNAVIADGVIAVQPDASEVDHQRVARRSGLNVKRTGFRMAAQHAGHTFLVSAAGIYRGGVDGIAGPDRQHRLVERRELAVKGGRNKLVTLRRTGAARRHKLGGKQMRDRMREVVTVDEDRGARHRVALKGSLHLFTAPTVVFGKEMEGIAVHRAFQLVAAELAGELVALLLQVEPEEKVGTVKVGADYPFAGEIGLLCEHQHWDKQQEK